jgi:hypothetical protein
MMKTCCTYIDIFEVVFAMLRTLLRCLIVGNLYVTFMSSTKKLTKQILIVPVAELIDNNVVFHDLYVTAQRDRPSIWEINM